MSVLDYMLRKKKIIIKNMVFSYPMARTRHISDDCLMNLKFMRNIFRFCYVNINVIFGKVIA